MPFPRVLAQSETQFCSGFELWLHILFPVVITITLRIQRSSIVQAIFVHNFSQNYIKYKNIFIIRIQNSKILDPR